MISDKQSDETGLLAGPIQCWGVLLLGIATSVWGVSLELKEWTSSEEAAEHIQIYQLQSAIVDKIEDQSMLLQSVAGLFAASQVVQSSEWTSFVETLAKQESNSGALSMGYVISDDQGNWQCIQTPIDQQTSTPLFERLVKDPAARAAMDASARSNQPTMSATLSLTDTITGQPLRVICMPIAMNARQKAAHSQSWAIIVTSISQLVNSAIGRNPAAHAVQSLTLSDSRDVMATATISRDGLQWSNKNPSPPPNVDDKQLVVLAHRPFELNWVYAPPRYDLAIWTRAGSVLGMGLTVTLLLHVLVRRLNRSRLDNEHNATHDALTNLPNRAMIKQRLERAMAKWRDEPNYRIAVLFLDIDHFKVINDSLGHPYGDELLRQVADRIRLTLRTSTPPTHDRADMPARLGGDEFVIILEARDSMMDAVTVADRLGHALGEPYNLMGQEVVTSASIGIVVPDTEHQSAEDILRDADLAMYHAKEHGRARFALFDSDMRQKAIHRLKLEKEMRHAEQRDELYLMYQPIVCLETGDTMGFEALIRWKHPELGLVRPDEFIGVAEETGLIVDIGYWVLRTASRQLAQWRKTLPNGERLFMNVNASRRELTVPGYVSRVEQTLGSHDLPPGSVKLELTESDIMGHYHELTPIMRQLRAMGIPLCMDDFGTGHSSLSCLHTFPLDVLKIDRAFIRNMGEQISYTAIVQAVVTLAHTLNMTVVAEGIELPEHLAQLQALEADLAQGYYFAKPMTAEDTEQWEMARKRSPKQVG